MDRGKYSRTLGNTVGPWEIQKDIGEYSWTIENYIWTVGNTVGHLKVLYSTIRPREIIVRSRDILYRRTAGNTSTVGQGELWLSRNAAVPQELQLEFRLNRRWTPFCYFIEQDTIFFKQINYAVNKQHAVSNYFTSQSTYIYRAPQCMSPRWNWDSPTPLSECALPPVPKGGGAHSPAAKGVGESQFQQLEKRLALCLLCALH